MATNLPPYAEAIGAGALVIGLLIAVYDFAELFAKPLAGFIADRRGMKLTLLAGLGIFIAGSLLFLFINPKLLLLFASSRESVRPHYRPSRFRSSRNILQRGVAPPSASITRSKVPVTSSRPRSGDFSFTAMASR